MLEKTLFIWGLVLFTAACNVGGATPSTEETILSPVVETSAVASETASEFVSYWIGSEAPINEESVQIGCETYLSPLESTIAQTTPEENISASLSLIFTTQPQAGQRNVWAEDLNFTVSSVTIENGLATIQLAGEIMMRGVCADVEMEAQVLMAIFAENSVEQARIMIGDTNMRQYFDMSGNSSADSVYTRDDIPLSN